MKKTSPNYGWHQSLLSSTWEGIWAGVYDSHKGEENELCIKGST
jgi:hypothetical protein